MGKCLVVARRFERIGIQLYNQISIPVEELGLINFHIIFKTKFIKAYAKGIR